MDEHFDLRPGAFREYLDLHRPIYQKTAAYGHFGREDHDFTWEKTDKADALRAGRRPGRARRGAGGGVGRRGLPARAHPEHLYVAAHALEAAAADRRPGVGLAGGVAHLS